MSFLNIPSIGFLIVATIFILSVLFAYRFGKSAIVALNYSLLFGFLMVRSFGDSFPFSLFIEKLNLISFLAKYNISIYLIILITSFVFYLITRKVISATYSWNKIAKIFEIILLSVAVILISTTILLFTGTHGVQALRGVGDFANTLHITKPFALILSQLVLLFAFNRH